MGLMLPVTGMAQDRSTGEPQGAPNENDKCLAPYFVVSGGDEAGEQFPLKKTESKVVISGVIAAIEIRQVYANEGDDVIEAKYLFPASTRAAVQGMEMQIGERRVRAKIKEKKAAKAAYETAKAEKKTAALLVQKRPNVFSMSVANILPGDRVEVILRYSEILQATEGVYEFVYPTVVGPRYSNGTESSEDSAQHNWVVNPYLEEGESTPADFQFTLQLNAGMPIQSLTCPSHHARIDFEDKERAGVTLSGAKDSDRDVIVRYQLADKNIVSGLLLHEGADENFFLLNVQPPERVVPKNIPPRDYVFVVDVSGSMNGFPLQVTKGLFRDLIGGLRSEDSFNILLFAGSSQSLSRSPLPATADNVRRGIDFLDNRRGGGGTQLVRALEDAISLPGDENRSRSMIVITDGYVSMEAEAFESVRKGLGQANLFAFGIGSSINRHLIEGLAAVGRGEPFVVTSPEEGKRVARQLREYISSPVLTKVKVTTTGARISETEPANVPDVFAARPLVLTGKYRGRASGTITVTGLTGGGETFRQEFHLNEARLNGAENPALRSLWARERVRALADYAQGSGDPEAVQEVTNLGLTYELLTPYTSFVAVDELVREVKGEARLVAQPLPLPKGVSASAVASSGGGGSSITDGSVPEPGAVALVLATMSALLFLRTRQRGNGS